MTDSQPTLGEAVARRAAEDSDNEPVDESREAVSFDAGFPDDVDAAATQAAREVLRTAPSTDRVYALVSGGHDSLTAMHIVYQSSLPLDGIIHIRTGIGIPETRKFVRERADELGLEYHEVGAKHDEPGYHSEHRRVHEEYEELVKQFGFPGPGAHKWMYVNLKENPSSGFSATSTTRYCWCLAYRNMSRTTGWRTSTMTASRPTSAARRSPRWSSLLG